jgi:hypothetical protein
MEGHKVGISMLPVAGRPNMTYTFRLWDGTEFQGYYGKENIERVSVQGELS